MIAVDNNNSEIKLSRRNATVSASGIIFSDNNRVTWGAVDNGINIPYQIYGIKFVAG